jgi:hypothetical protein
LVAVPAEELHIDYGRGEAATFEVLPDVFRQAAVVPLRDVSRCDLTKETVRQAGMLPLSG